MAEHFRHRQYAQLNSDVFTKVIDCDRQQMVEAYQRAKQAEGLRKASIYAALLTLGHFARPAGPCSSQQITQQILERLVLRRSQKVKKDTLNKDIRNTSSFLRWAVQNRYIRADLQVKEVKVAQEPVRVISEPVNPIQVNLSLPGAEYFLPVTLICGICVLATAIRVPAVGKYTWSQAKRP